MRIRGTIGEWPVDLTVELDARDWAELAARVPDARPPVAEPQAQPAAGGDPLWPVSLELLRQAGQMEGTALLAELSALAGSAEAGKRLLVRLRHHAQVRVESGGDTPLYRWLG